MKCLHGLTHDRSVHFDSFQNGQVPIVGSPYMLSVWNRVTGVTFEQSPHLWSSGVFLRLHVCLELLPDTI